MLKKAIQRWISLILAFVLVFGMVPPDAFVAHATEVDGHNHELDGNDSGSGCEITGEHSYTVEVEGTRIPATCTTEGFVTMKCETCDLTQDQVLPVDGSSHTGETRVDNAKDATETEAGYTGDTICVACGGTVTTGEVIPATGSGTPPTEGGEACTHTGGAATCMAPAVCDLCGQPYGDVNSANHTGNTTTVGAKAATCGTAGYSGDVTCECGVTVTKGEETAATGVHTYGDWSSTKDGAERTCTVCETAKETKTLTAYRWEMNDEGTALVSITGDGLTENTLGDGGGSISGGKTRLRSLSVQRD